MASLFKKPLFVHYFYPLFVLIALSIVISFTHADLLLADYFYSLQGHSWAWKDTWITEKFFHKGGRAVSILLACIMTVLSLASLGKNVLTKYRNIFLYLFLATASASWLVSFLKSILGVSCPWEFIRYGGNLDYLTLPQQLRIGNGEGCFPAAHASAGYAWLSLYFAGLHYQSRWRWFGLAFALSAGALLGFVQQIRGAHFISHDLWTLAVCWFSNLTLYLIMFRANTKL
jgi:membrane-associated PAP2 superfamily phosphatase